MEFFDTLRQVKTNWNPYKKWEIEQQKKDKQNEQLRKKYPPTPEELENAKQYGRTIVDVINTMDQHSIDKSEDAMVVVGSALRVIEIASLGIGTGLGYLTRFIPAIKKRKKLHNPFMLIGLMVGTMTTSTIANIWGAIIEKQASRIARFQTREKDLKESRNFVVYNQEQIDKAKEIAKDLPDKKEDKNSTDLKSSYNPIVNLKKAKKTSDELAADYKIYEEWKKGYIKEEALKIEKFKDLNPAKEESEKAEKDRDVLLNTIKKIENSSLNYTMNMSMARHTINTALFSSALGVGIGLSKLIDALQDKAILTKKSSLINSSKGLLPLILPIVIMVTTMGSTAKMVKDAARIGRYKAKKELLENPENFIAYTDEQRETIGDVKLPKQKKNGFIERFKQDVREIKQLKKEYLEYQNYMNTTRKEELKLDEALKQVAISDKQKTDAQQLQKKAFHSFEKMDEKAQRFTDDTDAAVDSVRNTATGIIGTAGKITTLLYLNDKLVHYNEDKIPSAMDIFKLSKHLTHKEIMIALAAFVAPAFVNMPLIVRGIQIKKEAGKIGVMTAMNDLNDPKNFLDEKGK